MSALKQWMDEEARALAQSLARINLNEMDARSMGGYGLRTRAITFLETVKSALFPALYEVDAATPGHLVTLSEERLYATAEQLKGIARDVFFGQCAREGREACDRVKVQGARRPTGAGVFAGAFASARIAHRGSARGL